MCNRGDLRYAGVLPVGAAGSVAVWSGLDVDWQSGFSCSFISPGSGGLDLFENECLYFSPSVLSGM